MERLKMMKESLMNCVQGQMGDLKNTNAKELGEAIDMIKDLAEAEYYCSVVKAMEDSEKTKETMKFTYPPVMYNGGNMRMNEEPRYYDGGNMSSQGGTRYYPNGMTYPRYYTDYSSDMRYPAEIRDYREGRSPVSRRMYMESKELHHGKEKQMQDLEKYMKELTEDIMEMINDATPEEKTILTQKLNTLASKIS